MKKILFITNNLKGGGAEKYLVNLLKELKLKKRVDIEFELLLISEYGVYLDEVKDIINVDTILKKNSILNEGKFIEKKYIRKILTCFRLILIKYIFPYFLRGKFEKYDTIISFLEGPPTGIIRKIKNKKKIAWIHSDLRKAKTYYTKKENLENYKNIDKIICVSNSAKNSFLELYPNYALKVEVIYNFINEREILEKSLEKIYYEKKKITLITIGRLTIEKNQICLFKACKKLRREGIDFELIVLGEGNKRKEYEKYLLENKLQDRIKLLGFKKNPYPYLKLADIFILPSLYEGYGLVLCEAMILNKLIICSDFEAGKEILNNGKYGKLFKNNDCDDLVEKIKECYFNDERIKSIKSKLKELDWQKSKDKILKKIEQIILK